jgi:hypothetical protein
MLRFAQLHLITRTDGSLPLCFLPHSSWHLCYDAFVHVQGG